MHIAPPVVGPPEVGTGFTVTGVVYTVAFVHPEPEPDTTNEYVPLAVGVNDGFCTVDANPDGPVHDHEVAPVELAKRLAVPPTHSTPPLVGPLDAGPGVTVTVEV